MLYGDCEDYSLTLLWLVANRNKKQFWKLLKTHYSLHFVKLRSGEGHLVLEDELTGKFVDNIQRKLVYRETLLSNGYRFKFRVPRWFVWIKLKI